ncbi:MAG: winged helix-turn-helix transcriptional regulator [Vampirovibrionales bacterium]
MMQRSIIPHEIESPQRPLRSCCPVAMGLDVLGDKWTLLIIRDLIFGKSRFKEFLSSPERIASNILTDRLQRLVTEAIIVQMEDPEGGKYRRYCLTPKGEALVPVLQALRAWGLAWYPESEDRLTPK